MLLSAALLRPADASAFPLDGCQLTLTSYDAAGAQMDQATGGAGDATQQDPLRVAWAGSVGWTRTGLPASGGAWQIDVYGTPTMLRGSDEGSTSGRLFISDTMPFRFSGLLFVSGRLAGADHSCTGSGWIRMVGDPITTLAFTLSLALLLVGLVLLAVAARGRWVAAIFGGMMFGLGSALLLVSYAMLPFAQATPYLVLAGGLMIGLAAGGYGSIQSRRPGASWSAPH